MHIDKCLPQPGDEMSKWNIHLKSNLTQAKSPACTAI